MESISARLECDPSEYDGLIKSNMTGKEISQVFLVQVENQDIDVTYVVRRQSEKNFSGKLKSWGSNPAYKDDYNNILIKFDDGSYIIMYRC